MKITEFTEPQRDLNAELEEFGIDSRGQRVEPPQEMKETEPMTDEPLVDEVATTRTGTQLPKGALPMKRRPESRMLPENVESREAQPMGGIKRRTFDEVNNRSQEQKDAQHPEARYADGRLKQKNRREKTREKYSLMPEEMREEPPPKKKATKPKAQRSKKAKKTEIEGTQVMQEEPPKKKNTGIKAKEGKKPVKEDIVGAQVMQEPAKPKTSAKKIVETTAKNRKEEKGQGVKPFPKPAQKARTRPKNEKKEGVNEANKVAAQARSEQRQKAKKKEAVSEPEDKTYTRYISGSTDKDYVNEVVEAARNGNASAISRLRNDKADLVDHHGFSDDEIDEITG